MTTAEFKKSLNESRPPDGVTDLLRAIWYDCKGGWETSQNIAQDIESNEGSWVHAYLHRKEGDVGNAGYWYNRAGRKFPKYSLDEEWAEIVGMLLRGNS